MPTLYQGDYLRGPECAHLIQDSVLKLCNDLKVDAVSLVDAVAPPDFILNSILGASDGKVKFYLLLFMKNKQKGVYIIVRCQLIVYVGWPVV